jgi:hypothetical protein
MIKIIWLNILLIVRLLLHNLHKWIVSYLILIVNQSIYMIVIDYIMIIYNDDDNYYAMIWYEEKDHSVQESVETTKE